MDRLFFTKYENQNGMSGRWFKLLQSNSLTQIKSLMILFILLFILQISLILSGLNDFINDSNHQIIEIMAALLLLLGAIIVFKKYRKIKRFFIDLEEEELNMTALIQSMPDFVCFKDGQGRWIRTNDFGLDLYGLKGKKYRGKTDRELGKVNPFFEEAFEFCMVSDEETWQKAVTVRADESFNIPSGEFKTFDVIKVPIFYEDGSRKALITIGRDITQQKQAEERLVKQEKLAVAGELAAGIAHEIKNPLTSLKGFIQLMREENKLSSDNVDIMSSEMDRIHSIVEELLVLSKPQTRLEQAFSLHSAIEYVVNVLKHQAAEKKVALRIEKTSNKPDFVLGDRNQLIQVFINLVKNGIESMEKGGVLTIQRLQQENEISIYIKDEGIGMPVEKLEKIGEPFFTTKSKGMGLGLTICQKIIHEHKGRIEYESAENEGTTVSVHLPVYKEEKNTENTMSLC
ncbi:ATP-binding protein [Jeotgalibacillus campisalis]|uniref:histidine kinase n=1 Tax=Jeotgalibacillus campisalis TaxID=220754 RepID=A0A0C2RR59_9BACL|nr:ATP-binding protein [Jeotgalibacillus campisalis]KIL52755.1 sporulation kinase [Jeotgalibacillus campisalis]